MFLRPSSWTFVTSGTGGLNVDIFAAAGGSIDFLDPSHKQNSILAAPGWVPGSA